MIAPRGTSLLRITLATPLSSLFPFCFYRLLFLFIDGSPYYSSLTLVFVAVSVAVSVASSVASSVAQPTRSVT